MSPTLRIVLDVIATLSIGAWMVGVERRLRRLEREVKR